MPASFRKKFDTAAAGEGKARPEADQGITGVVCLKQLQGVGKLQADQHIPSVGCEVKVPGEYALDRNVGGKFQQSGIPVDGEGGQIVEPFRRLATSSKEPSGDSLMPAVSAWPHQPGQVVETR